MPKAQGLGVASDYWRHLRPVFDTIKQLVPFSVQKGRAYHEALRVLQAAMPGFVSLFSCLRAR